MKHHGLFPLSNKDELVASGSFLSFGYCSTNECTGDLLIAVRVVFQQQ